MATDYTIMDNDRVGSNPNPSALLKVGNITPKHNFEIWNPEGKKAIIGFNGDKVTFGGDLPMDEAVKIFFESVFGLCNCKDVREGI